jgi:hypothetical protein
MRKNSILETISKEKADPNKAALAVAALAFLMTAAALKTHMIPAEPPIRPSVSDQAVTILWAGQAAAGFLLFMSSLGIYLRRDWGKRVGQASFLLIFTGLLYLLFRWYLAGDDAALSPDGDSKLGSEILVSLLLAPLTVILFFGLRYLQRLPNKRRHSHHRA